MPGGEHSDNLALPGPFPFLGSETLEGYSRERALLSAPLSAMYAFGSPVSGCCEVPSVCPSNALFCLLLLNNLGSCL